MLWDISFVDLSLSLVISKQRVLAYLPPYTYLGSTTLFYGNPQGEQIAKEKATAPTVALDSVFITSTIVAKISRKVVTINIPGAFLYTPITKTT
jgi:hypothetical protein